MSVHRGSGGSITFDGVRIGQVTSWSVREGRADVDGDAFADTTVSVDVQFDVGLNAHTLDMYRRGDLSVVMATGKSSFSVADARLIRREIFGTARSIVSGRLEFESLRSAVF